MTKQLRSIIICLVSLFLLQAGPALAHKVNIYGYSEGGKLKGQAYFAGGNPARECEILLLDDKGQQIGSAKTGVDGAFEMALPKAKPPLKLVVVAGEGHQGEFILKAEDLGLAQDGAQPTAEPKPVDSSAPQAAIADTAQLEQALAKVVEQKIAPLRAQISRMAAEQPSKINEIIGGIGWIIGLLGIAAFFLARRKNTEQG